MTLSEGPSVARLIHLTDWLKNLILDAGFYSEAKHSILMTQAVLMSHPLWHVMVSLSNKIGQKHIEKIWQEIIKKPTNGFLGGPVVKNLSADPRGHAFDPWSRKI